MKRQLCSLSMVLLCTTSVWATTRPPFGWMELPDKSVVLDISQEGVTEGCRHKASVFVGWILREFTRAEVNTYLSIGFVKQEATYYRRELRGSWSNKQYSEINGALASALDGFEKKGEIDWAVLDALDAKHDFTGQRRWPWSIGADDDFDKRLVHLAGQLTQPSRILEIKVDWGGQRRYYVGGVRQPGRGRTVWNLSGSLKLKDKDGKVLFQRKYGPGEWKFSYRGLGDTPSRKVERRIHTDIRRGLQKPWKPPRVSRPDTASIAGSHWVLVEEIAEERGAKRKRIVSFKQDGSFSYSFFGKSSQGEGDGWKQEGDIVRFSINDHYLEYVGIIDEQGRMAGTGRGAHFTWTWTATRTDSQQGNSSGE